MIVLLLSLLTIYNAQKLDDDCQTDTQQLELAFAQVRSELYEAIEEHHKQENSEIVQAQPYNLYRGNVVALQQEQGEYISSDGCSGSELNFRPIKLNFLFDFDDDSTSSIDSPDDLLKSFHFRLDDISDNS